MGEGKEGRERGVAWIMTNTTESVAASASARLASRGGWNLRCMQRQWFAVLKMSLWST